MSDGRSPHVSLGSNTHQNLVHKEIPELYFARHKVLNDENYRNSCLSSLKAAAHSGYKGKVDLGGAGLATLHHSSPPVPPSTVVITRTQMKQVAGTRGVLSVQTAGSTEPRGFSQGEI